MSQNRPLPPQDDFARALLRSADADEPSNAAYAKVAAALGVSTAVGVASLPAPAALAAGSSGFARWSSSVAGKLAALGVSGALVVGAGAALLHHRSSANAAAGRVALGAAVPLKAAAPVEPAALAANGTPPSGAQQATALNAASAPSAAASPAPDPALLGTPEQPIDADAEEAAAAMPRPARSAGRAALASAGASRALASSGSAGSSTSSLSEQVQSLDRARVALSAGDAGAALIEIAHYRKAWPKGVFLTEASVLEIEALAKRGERSLAAARAQAFVTAHPDSPQAERLRALIPQPAPKEQ